MLKDTLDERIQYEESPLYKIAQSLKDKGYILASNTGVREKEVYDRNCIGILKPRKPIIKKFLGIKIPIHQRALYIADLWLKNEAREAGYSNWVLDINGRENVNELTELVKELSEPTKAKVKIRLKSEESKLETYMSDYDL
jgi:hypothetical protein